MYARLAFRDFDSNGDEIYDEDVKYEKSADAANNFDGSDVMRFIDSKATVWDWD